MPNFSFQEYLIIGFAILLFADKYVPLILQKIGWAKLNEQDKQNEINITQNMTDATQNIKNKNQNEINTQQNEINNRQNKINEYMEERLRIANGEMGDVKQSLVALNTKVDIIMRHLKI